MATTHELTVGIDQTLSQRCANNVVDIVILIPTPACFAERQGTRSVTCQGSVPSHVMFTTDKNSNNKTTGDPKSGTFGRSYNNTTNRPSTRTSGSPTLVRYKTLRMSRHSRRRDDDRPLPLRLSREGSAMYVSTCYLCGSGIGRGRLPTCFRLN